MSRRPLGDLLDRIQAAHKADVQELAGGHLNESKLRRFEQPQRNKLLEAAAAGASRDKQPDFRSGPSVPLRRVRMAPPKQQPQQQPQRLLHSEALVEELNLEPRGQRAAQDTVLAACRSEGRYADDLRRRRQLQRQLVREQDATERQLLTGAARVRDLEERLQENLNKKFGSSSSSSGPSFHRLQIYGAALSEIVHQSPTFGSVLAEIQSAYDEYLSELLDSTQATQHRHLQQQLSHLRDPEAESELRLCQQLVEEQELEAERQLALAEQLQQERLRLQQLPSPLLELQQQQQQQQQQKKRAASPRELVGDRCQSLLESIWHDLDAIGELRERLRNEHAPMVTAQHLERCGKDAQNELQGIEDELQEVEAANSGLSERIEAALRAEDLPEEERQRVVALLSNASAEFALGNENLDLDPLLLGNETHKWEWYIS